MFGLTKCRNDEDRSSTLTNQINDFQKSQTQQPQKTFFFAEPWSKLVLEEAITVKPEIAASHVVIEVSEYLD